MKLFASIWKTVSIPVLMAAGLLVWWGVKNWSSASAFAHPITVAQLGTMTDGVHYLQDSVEFDLTSPGLRQENHYGFKGPAIAVFPVHPVGDSTMDSLNHFAVVSSESRFVGPSIRTFLRSDSMAVTDVKVSSNDGQHIGSVGPEMQALVQITAEKLGHAPLDLPNKGRAFIEGVVHQRTEAEFPDLVAPAPSVWEIRTGAPPSMGLVIGAFVLAALLLLKFVVFNRIVGKWEKSEIEREDAEREEEKGLV